MQPFLKKKKWLGKMVLKLFTTFLVVEGQFPPSWLHPNIGLLSGVIVPVFIEFIGLYVFDVTKLIMTPGSAKNKPKSKKKEKLKTLKRERHQHGWSIT